MREEKLGVTVLILNLRGGICCFKVNLEHGVAIATYHVLLKLASYEKENVEIY